MKSLRQFILTIVACVALPLAAISQPVFIDDSFHREGDKVVTTQEGDKICNDKDNCVEPLDITGNIKSSAKVSGDNMDVGSGGTKTELISRDYDLAVRSPATIGSGTTEVSSLYPFQ